MDQTLQVAEDALPGRIDPLSKPLLQLTPPAGGWLDNALGRRAADLIGLGFGLGAINGVYAKAIATPLPQGVAATPEFVRRVLEAMDVRIDLSPGELARIPKSGPLIVVANHPFGAMDGLVLMSILSQMRPDSKVMANHLLTRVPELLDGLLLIDPFGGKEAAARNASSMRRAMRWLAEGHVLGAFPAGEVAHLKWSAVRQGVRTVTDPCWHSTVARLARRTGVPILPIYFEGQNKALFQAAGLIHDRLRTAMLPRAFLDRRATTVSARIGSIIPAKRAAAFETDEALVDHLRRRTFLLRQSAPRPSIRASETLNAVGARAKDEPAKNESAAKTLQPISRRRKNLVKVGAETVARAWRVARKTIHPVHPPTSAESIIDPVDPGLMAAEIAELPAHATLLEHDDFLVLHAKASQIRHSLREIGRLREVTFRQVGEGTLRSIDLDTFDYDYDHLFIWNRQAREIVGAYRLGRTDELLPAKGRGGLYTSTLFNYDAELLRRLDPALEMGRSFVRPEYQKSYAPLLLLWKGIGHFLVRNPRYRYLFGPVSISQQYQTVSRQLMVQFLTLHHAMPDGEALARPKNPFRPGRGVRLQPAEDRIGDHLLLDDDEVSGLIADLEPDGKGIPVLVRQYLKLGAKFLSFNLDSSFGDCLDGLIVVDLVRTEARVLERYMTRPGYAQFMAHQAALATDQRGTACKVGT